MEAVGKRYMISWETVAEETKENRRTIEKRVKTKEEKDAVVSDNCKAMTNCFGGHYCLFRPQGIGVGNALSLHWNFGRPFHFWKTVLPILGNSLAVFILEL